MQQTEGMAASDADEVEASVDVGGLRHRRHEFPGRNRRVMLRLSDEEFAAIEVSAGRAGLTPSGFCAQAAVAVAVGTTPPVPSPLQEALRELMQARTQVRKFGTNVNQAVAALNATGQAPTWLGDAVRLTGEAVARLDEAAARLARRLRG